MASVLKVLTAFSVRNFVIQGVFKNKTVDHCNFISCSRLHRSSRLLQDEEGEEPEEAEGAEMQDEGVRVGMTRGLWVPIHDVETSMRYLQSNAYKITYRGELVWVPYRRNFKGSKPPKQTRKKCIRGGIMSTGNPCPVCRDEYLVVHYKNVDLLKQFLSPISGELLSANKTGVCRDAQKNLLLEVMKAMDEGLIKMNVPRRQYNYGDYYPHLRKSSISDGEHTSTETVTMVTDNTVDTPKEEQEVAV